MDKKALLIANVNEPFILLSDGLCRSQIVEKTSLNLLPINVD